MPHRTTRTDLSKLWKLPITWLKASLAALPQRWFAASDASARQYGWQVTSTHCGLGRRYRDPRFDTLAACECCCGGITASGNSCQRCTGTGRIIVRPADEPPASPPRGLAWWGGGRADHDEGTSVVSYSETLGP